LPRGRGPNPIRLLYEGDLTLAGTVHRLVPEYDAGAVLSIKTKRIDTDIMSRDLFGIWQELLDAALDEAVARAVAGDPGDPQTRRRQHTPRRSAMRNAKFPGTSRSRISSARSPRST
jgi:methionyl-tRNA formyltransferase